MLMDCSGLQSLPPEVIVEIFKFSVNDLKVVLSLTQVCKNWKMILENDEFGFYNFLYNSLFGWRNNKQQNSLQQSYQYLLQNEIQFWNYWTFKDCDGFSLKSIKPNILQITRNTFGEKKNFINNRPLLYNTGVYYFEIKSIEDRGVGDNLFVGFILVDKNLDNINHNNGLGCTGNNSFGLFFCNGDIYNNNNPQSYANGHISKNTVVGVYLDTNNLKVRFVLVKYKKVFQMVNLDEFYTKELLENYCNGQLVLFPAVSMLYEEDVMKLNTTAGFKSIEKAKWIRNVLSKE